MKLGMLVLFFSVQALAADQSERLMTLDTVQGKNQPYRCELWSDPGKGEATIRINKDFPGEEAFTATKISAVQIEVKKVKGLIHSAAGGRIITTTDYLLPPTMKLSVFDADKEVVLISSRFWGKKASLSKWEHSQNVSPAAGQLHSLADFLCQ